MLKGNDECIAGLATEPSGSGLRGKRAWIGVPSGLRARAKRGLMHVRAPIRERAPSEGHILLLTNRREPREQRTTQAGQALHEDELKRRSGAMRVKPRT